MADEPDPDRLRALEARLKQVKGEATKADASVGTGFSQGEVAWRMIIELVTGMVIGIRDKVYQANAGRAPLTGLATRHGLCEVYRKR
jgi:hypothetical protein